MIPPSKSSSACPVCGGRDLGTTDGPDGEQWPVVCGACTPAPDDDRPDA